jgi:hypothetical protein
VRVHAVDPDDPPGDLTVLLYVDESLADTASPGTEGEVDFALADLGPGDHTLRAQAIDPDGGVGADELEISVQDPDEPLVYTLSGGESVFAWWSVDDDVVVSVDGVAVFTDANGHQSTHPPLEIEAEVGSILSVVATDVNPTRKMLSDLVLHFGTERSQPVFEVQSASSNPADPDYDPDYAGPWPNDFVDVDVEVAIP